MLGSLKTFIAGLTGDARPRNPRDDGCRLATAALLVQMSSADRELSQPALRNLHCVLKSRFRLDNVATAALLDAAAAAERRATDLYHFTRRLNEVLDHDGRRLVVGMMWQIAYADGRASEFASHIIWRAADLLGVSARERIELRNRSAAERGMLANQWNRSRTAPLNRMRRKLDIDLVFPIKDEVSAWLMCLKAELLFEAGVIDVDEKCIVLAHAAAFLDQAPGKAA